jgi:hypothetical protein
MSDTPITDAFFKQVWEGQCLSTCDSYAHDEKCPVANGEHLIADFARRLERLCHQQHEALLLYTEQPQNGQDLVIEALEAYETLRKEFEKS